MPMSYQPVRTTSTCRPLVRSTVGPHAPAQTVTNKPAVAATRAARRGRMCNVPPGSCRRGERPLPDRLDTSTRTSDAMRAFYIADCGLGSADWVTPRLERKGREGG